MVGHIEFIANIDGSSSSSFVYVFFNPLNILQSNTSTPFGTGIGSG
jgi:hypothetical protein